MISGIGVYVDVNQSLSLSYFAWKVRSFYINLQDRTFLKPHIHTALGYFQG
jgi:hypothetical protein